MSVPWFIVYTNTMITPPERHIPLKTNSIHRDISIIIVLLFQAKLG